MSKMGELSMVLDDLIKCGEELTKTARSLRDFYTSTSDGNEEPAEQVQGDLEKRPTVEDVRKVLVDIARTQGTDEVKKLLKKYGADCISKVSPDDYGALLKDVEAIHG